MLKELTPEMQAAIPAHAAKWIANGRRTDVAFLRRMDRLYTGIGVETLMNWR